MPEGMMTEIRPGQLKPRMVMYVDHGWSEVRRAVFSPAIGKYRVYFDNGEHREYSPGEKVRVWA